MLSGFSLVKAGIAVGAGLARPSLASRSGSSGSPASARSSARSSVWSQPEPSLNGIALPGFYGAGSSLPMLAAGYASQAFRGRTSFLTIRPMLVRLASGELLVGLSVWIPAKGLVGAPW